MLTKDSTGSIAGGHKTQGLHLSDMKKLKGGDIISNMMAISEQQHPQRTGHGSASPSPLQSFTALGH